MTAAAKFLSALSLLREARIYADLTACDAWEFAVEIQELRALGLSNNDLRFLVRRRFVSYAGELSSGRHNSRKFDVTDGGRFNDNSCFVLTPEGVEVANVVMGHKVDALSVGLPPLHVFAEPKVTKRAEPPLWDFRRRVLSFEGQVIKQFKWPAPNQEIILSAFQEEGWPVRIDDPLVPIPCLDIKRRLSDTIKCLNRNQMRKEVNFRGDGSGQGVLWERVLAPHSPALVG